MSTLGEKLNAGVRTPTPDPADDPRVLEAAAAAAAMRIALRDAGTIPIPLFGKVPPNQKNNERGGLPGWQGIRTVSDDRILQWGGRWFDATNTGVLTFNMPTFDVDIHNAAAARAVEALVRETFEKRGRLLMRIGLPPKRAFVFRTEQPFAKLPTINFAGGKGEKLEFLGDGQQIVVDGIHPETGRPYEWFGGELFEVTRAELPPITEAEARALMKAVEELLIRDFGYERGSDQIGGGGMSGDREVLVANILEGADLHNSLCSLAAKLAAAGTGEEEAIAFLQDLMDKSKAPKDARWQDRYDDIPRLVESGEEKYGGFALVEDWSKTPVGEALRKLAAEHAANDNKPSMFSETVDDLARLNRVHAVLPIGGKTRVVTFGEHEDFPGRETIVMTQTIGDFVALLNKYRHEYIDAQGEWREVPMGSWWIGNAARRQYDDGMAFMPRHDGDVGRKLNLWRGFGVATASGSCERFLNFAYDIICSGDDTNYDYLLKREAFILQKRTRSEVALGLQSKEEGVGKGFYEKTLRRITGHAMQLNNPDHIIGKFNPHLEQLLRLTADEALFVGDPKHRNALFGLITESEMEIEPKHCGLYTAKSYLNLSITSNSEHFLPVSDTARRFFIPTVSAARKGDHAYFADLQAELDAGGYEALLFYLLHEVDFEGFNVRKVPQTEGLMQQRNQSLPPLEAWWCELLEIGSLRGADPEEPRRAVSNGYTRLVRIDHQIRHINQLGIYDQARQIEPRLRAYTSDHKLGRFLSEMGCDNTKKVLRRQGWTFPPLAECRAKWETRFVGWKWRNPGLAGWQPEEGDQIEEFAAKMRDAGLA